MFVAYRYAGGEVMVLGLGDDGTILDTTSGNPHVDLVTTSDSAIIRITGASGPTSTKFDTVVYMQSVPGYCNIT